MLLSKTGKLILFSLLAGCVASRAAGENSIESNLEYRLTWGDLTGSGDIIAAPGQSRRALRIAAGGDQLLELCKENPGHWQRDPLLFRFGHSHPTSTIGCRERTSPSLHAVFYRQPDGSREAWVHFDLHGPQETLPHLSEVLRNRMTFGRTSEYEVYRGLLRTNPNVQELVPAPRYDFAAHARQYVRDAFGPGAIGMAAASSVATTGLHSALGFGATSGYADRFATNVTRNAVAQSIEFGTAAFLQQEEKFRPSQERGFGRRARIALYRTFFVPGRDGEELAFPRIAAALGTPWVMRPIHPGQIAPPNPWIQSAFFLGRYVARSYWAEFRPEISQAIRKLRRRDESNIAGR